MAKTIDDLYNALQTISIQLGKLIKVSQNASGIQVQDVIITSLSDPATIPAMTVPDGVNLIVKSRWSNGGTIGVAPKDDKNKITTLRPGQAEGFRVTNSQNLVITGTALNDIVELFCEKKP